MSIGLKTAVGLPQEILLQKVVDGFGNRGLLSSLLPRSAFAEK